jgi:hypothetical protein
MCHESRMMSEKNELLGLVGTIYGLILLFGSLGQAGLTDNTALASGIALALRATLLGLLTGNIRLGAEIKLRHFNLWELFTTGAFGDDHSAGILGSKIFHAGPDVGSFGAQQRHSLALHVRTHQSAVGVVVFQEGDQACRHTDQLLGGHVDVFDPFARNEHKIAGDAGIDAIAQQLAMLIHFHVGLGNGIDLGFPCCLVEGKRIILRRALFRRFDLFILSFDYLFLDPLAHFEVAV